MNRLRTPVTRVVAPALVAVALLTGLSPHALRASDAATNCDRHILDEIRDHLESGLMALERNRPFYSGSVDLDAYAGSRATLQGLYTDLTACDFPVEGTFSTAPIGNSLYVESHIVAILRRLENATAAGTPEPDVESAVFSARVLATRLLAYLDEQRSVAPGG
ncbi:MAG: hypothetical protein AAGA11_19060 [Pseudomonadota bacterium]